MFVLLLLLLRHPGLPRSCCSSRGSPELDPPLSLSHSCLLAPVILWAESNLSADFSARLNVWFCTEKLSSLEVRDEEEEEDEEMGPGSGPGGVRVTSGDTVELLRRLFSLGRGAGDDTMTLCSLSTTSARSLRAWTSWSLRPVPVPGPVFWGSPPPASTCMLDLSAAAGRRWELLQAPSPCSFLLQPGCCRSFLSGAGGMFPPCWLQPAAAGRDALKD